MKRQKFMEWLTQNIKDDEKFSRIFFTAKLVFISSFFNLNLTKEEFFLSIVELDMILDEAFESENQGGIH